MDSFPPTLKAHVDRLSLSTPETCQSLLYGPQPHWPIALQKFLEPPGQKSLGNPILDPRLCGHGVGGMPLANTSLLLIYFFLSAQQVNLTERLKAKLGHMLLARRRDKAL